MDLPIQNNSPEEALAKEISKELVIEGFASGLALPFAMKLIKIIDDAHDDPLREIKQIKEERRIEDEWWIKYWPATKFAKQAKHRIEEGRKNDNQQIHLEANSGCR